MTNLTFGIIKPDAVRAGHTGSIIQRILNDGFKIRALKLIHMTRKQAEGFYDVHRERPFFSGLTEFMSSGPCVVMALEKESAVKSWRDLMGATDPAKADAGTLRKEFGGSVGEIRQSSLVGIAQRVAISDLTRRARPNGRTER